MAVSLTVDNVVKRFGGFTALKSVDLRVEPGELFFLLGPSGCGKTTLLRSIAGFNTPESGRILIGERDVTQLPPYKRDTGMMFQSYALWPHLTLAENVAFGLEMRRIPRGEIRERVAEALEMVHLGERARDKPNQLSGGQQQRVALARALVIKPQCLLLDEPLSNLDAKLRLEMRVEIRRICKQAGLTAVYVTHDQKEALSVADRLAIMREGVIEQVGRPEEVYRRPANKFVAGFIGEANFIRGSVVSVRGGEVRVATACGEFLSTQPAYQAKIGDSVEVCIRPEAVRLDKAPADAANVFDGRVLESVYLGEVAQHTVELVCEGGSGERLQVFELNPLAGGSSQGESRRVWMAAEQVIVTRHEG